MLNPDLPPKVKVIDAGQSGLPRAPKSLTPSWEKNRRRERIWLQRENSRRRPFMT
jgi:hypothetical protein